MVKMLFTGYKYVVSFILMGFVSYSLIYFDEGTYFITPDRVSRYIVSLFKFLGVITVIFLALIFLYGVYKLIEDISTELHDHKED